MQPMTHTSRTHARRRRRPLCLAALLLWGLSPPLLAIENTSSANLNGATLDLSQATVSLTRVAGIASDAVAEIAPGTAPTGTETAFRFDLLATIAATNTGFDALDIVAPAAYTNLVFDTLSANGVGLTANCPAPAAGEYCAAVSGNTFAVTLGATLDAASTHVHAGFRARPPAAAGSAAFGATLTHAPSGDSLPATAGDADGDAADANSLTVSVVQAVVSGEHSDVRVDPPIVLADGIAAGTITVRLRDTNNSPLAGRTVSLASSRDASDSIGPGSGMTDADGVFTAAITSTSAGIASIVATDVASGFVLPTQPAVTFTQGLVLDLGKSIDRDTAQVGDLLTYRIEIRNTTPDTVESVQLVDSPAPVLRYRAGSLRLDGTPLPDPPDGSPLVFQIGDVAGLADANGNGIADEGEPGYSVLSYQMIVGAGARPVEYANQVHAIDVCASCAISAEAETVFAVRLDPLFDLGTIIGKVYEDTDGDGRQDKGEKGIADARVVLDDGTYALTDPHGRYHFPQVAPGQRMVKIDTNRLDRAVGRKTDRTVVVSVTPGLMARANFGVVYDYDAQRIGRDGVPGLLVASEADARPVRVDGSARMPSVAVNGRPIDLKLDDVRLRMRDLDDELRIVDGKLSEPVVFRFSDSTGTTRRWKLEVYDFAGRSILSRRGTAALPEQITWDGRDRNGKLVVGGGVYQYQLEVDYADGSSSRSERRLFGVNRLSTIQLELAGGAFVSGSHELTAEAKTLLEQTAAAIRANPGEQVVISGHTDAIGSAAANQKLSERRARAALKYLVEVERLPRQQFLVHGYGELRPRASNATESGRELNRRVEIHGELDDVQRALITRRQRSQPQVFIAGEPAAVREDGRFGAVIADPDIKRIDVEITTADARSVTTSVAIPTLEILSPVGQLRVPDSDTTEHTLSGRAEPGNEVEMDGRVLRVDADGRFSAQLRFTPGENAVGLMARNPDGVVRIVNLRTLVLDRDGDGQRVMYVTPIPELVLQLPPADTELRNAQLIVPGLTRPGNLVTVNETAVDVDENGYFAASVQLVEGANVIVAVVTDPQGYQGRIERQVQYKANAMFLLAFADARIAAIRTEGNLRAAGADKTNEIRVDGRVSFYLKGWIRGKYLVTSAYDSGGHDAGGVFADLDDSDSRRLLTNIDPDQHYPVYGDSSTVVYDTERTGKFYLAVESKLLDVRLGSYALNLSDTELSGYRRTLDGARVKWQSDDSDAPRTEATVFTSSVRQQAVHDVIATTGGMLYYLSQSDVIEGSEQVTLVVRDQNTGVVLRRVPQVRNSDYTIKYGEGRLLFRRPLSSMDADTTIIAQELLGGNPMSLEIDYETASSGRRQAIRGGRVQRRVGGALTVGGSYVEDRQLSSDYSLAGVDAELRLNEHARIVAELASSSGNDSINFVSTDGGLSYTTVAQSADNSGRALKLATEIDIGALRGKAPEQMQAGAYFKRLDEGFRSGGNAAESDSEKTGLHFAWKMSERSSLLARHDRQRAIAGDNATTQTTLQWNRHSDRLKLTLELQDRTSRSASGETSDTAVAGQAKMDWTGKLSTTLEYQQTLRGDDNQKTTAGLDYRVGEAITLIGRASVGTRGHAGEVGARVSLDGKHVYATRRRTRGASGSEDATVLGAESPYGEHGRVYSEYQWGTMGGRSGSRSLVGLRRRWQMTEGFNLLLAAEHSQLDMTADDGGRYTLALGLTYDNDGLFRARTLNEWRRDRGLAARSQFVTDTFAELDLNESFTLQGKFRRSHTTATGGGPGTAFHEQSLGLAYRPVENDRLNALARVTLLSEDPLQRDGLTGPSSSQVFSADWSYEIGKRLEWVGKQAFRLKESDAGGLERFTTRTSLTIQRMNLDLFDEFGLGLEYRRLGQDETDSTRTGWLAEVMWDHFQYLRLGLGFNFTDFSDDEFSDNEYSEYGWFLRLQGTY